MRVLVTTKRAPFEGRGAEQIIWRIGTHFADHGHEVRFFCPTPTTDTEVPKVDRVDFTFVPTSDDPTRSMITFFLRGPLRYRRAYRKFDPDVVYDNPSPFPFVPAHVYGDSPVISKVHAVYRRLAFACKQHPLVKVGTVVGEETYRLYRGERFVTNSESTAERLRVLVNTEKNRVVANPIGIQLKDYEFAYQPESRLVLSLSKLAPRKRIIDLLRAWPEVQSAIPEARLVVAGSGPRERALKRFARKRGVENVRFAGYVDDAQKHELLREAAVFASPTLYEGFGIANLEAMASGCAVVSTDTWGVRDYIHHRSNGLLVSPREPEELARAITEVLSDHTLRANITREGNSTARSYPMKTSLDRSLDHLTNVTSSIGS